MVSVCLPSDALLQHLPSYLGFCYLGCGVSLHSCSSKAQPLLLTLDEGFFLTAAPPDFECGVTPLSPLAPHSSRSLEVGLLLLAAAPDLGCVVAPLGHCPCPRTWGSSSWPPPLTFEVGKLLSAAAPDLGGGEAPLGRCTSAVAAWRSRSLPLTLV